MGDYNYTPDSYSKPYIQNSFTATQSFSFECSNYNSGNFYRLAPPISIYRQVFLDTDGKWKYQIQKSGLSNTVVLP